MAHIDRPPQDHGPGRWGQLEPSLPGQLRGSDPHFVIDAALFQTARMTRLRSRSKLARPYIWRLIILIRLTLPSTAPELCGRVRPLSTAAWSWLSPVVKERRSGWSSASTAALQASSRPPWRPVRILANSVT